ncbi:MAG TPA: response regulator [Chloroflexota bacterium]|nr:response regulator [Chloroflexota bacterium]
MSHTILIVDDSPTAAPELRTHLEREGYHVLFALRGEEALDTLQNSKIDLVITEALLPTMDGFELVHRIRQLREGNQVPIIMLTVRSAPEDYAASFEAGANEYFLKPMETPKLLAAVRGLITRYEMGRLERAGNGSSGSGALIARPDRGQIVTVFSLKGGVGCTTLAVNTAIAIKQAAPSARVGVIDLALEDGSAALLLDLVPTSTIADWSREDLAGATPHMLNQYFVQHRSGISVLAAPSSPEQAEMVRAGTVRMTLELAAQAFDYIIVDTSSTFSESMLIALELCHILLLPVTPDMAAVKSVVNTLRILKALKIGQSKVRVLQNEIIPQAGLTKEQLEASLGKGMYVIPHGGAAMMEASNQGTPLVSTSTTSPAARAIVELAREICVPEVADTPPAKQGVNLLVEGLQEKFVRLRRAHPTT